MINGYCDPRFLDLKEIFYHAVDSQFEVGASLAVEHEGKSVSYTHLTLPTSDLV